MTPQERFQEIIEEYIYCFDGSFEIADLRVEDGRYLLVEKSRHDGAIFLTKHLSPDSAAHYIDMQEYPEDWNAENLIDLETGDEYTAITTTEFERKQG